MQKDIRNTNVVACKLGLALIRVTNHRLEVARRKRKKREKMVKRWKTKAMATMWCKARKKISLSGEKKDENDTGDDMDPD